MLTVFFTLWKKWHSIRLMMIAGLCIKVKFMILQNMQKFIQEEEKFFWAKEKIVLNYIKNITLGLTASI